MTANRLELVGNQEPPAPVTPSPALTSASSAPLAANDPQPFLTNIPAGKIVRKLQEGESIFSQGDPSDAVFYIRSGAVKITVVSKRGKEAVVSILTADSFFGEGCLAGQSIRMSTAHALHPCTVLRLDKALMADLLLREPLFAQRFLAHQIARNLRMEADQVDLLLNSSRKRLARLLLLLANFGHEPNPIAVVAKVSQETIASMVGTTRSRVSFFLNRFRDSGFIDYNYHGMRIHSSLVNVLLRE
jgi:CRP-like cAMP-binding protein